MTICGRRWTVLVGSTLLLLLVGTMGCRKPAPEVTCGASLHPQALAKGLLILGELHGTAQAPAIVTATACEAAKRHGSAWIGLELSRSEQERIDAYLGGGSEAALLEGPSWTALVQDGRTSRAMFELLERVRALRQGGQRIDVIAFDVSPAEGYARRDARMAERVQAARADRPGIPAIILVGNGHATRRLALPQPMAWHLEAAAVPFLNLDLAYTGGAAWMSGQTRGGASQLLPAGPGAENFEQGFTTAAPPEGFDGWWFAGKLTASPPAVAPRD